MTAQSHAGRGRAPGIARRLLEGVARTVRVALAALVVLAATAAAAPVASAQNPGESHVTFWRGHLRIFATAPDTEVTLIDLATGTPLSPTLWAGNFATNPFVLDAAGDSFEASSLNLTHRVRVVATDARGPVTPTPVVVWTGWLATGLLHPLAPPPDQNAWMSYIPDMQQAGRAFGSEFGTTFLGFTSRDLWIIVKADGAPATVTIEDLATNTDADTDDSQVLDESSPELIHLDSEVAVFRVSGFEDDTIRVTTSAPASVLAGISSPDWPDWMTTPPSYGAGENGRELGTSFWFHAPRWLTILPVLDDTTVTITDLTDGDDTATITLANGSRTNPDYDIYVADPLGRTDQQAQPRPMDPAVAFVFPDGGPLDDDIVKVTSDRPILIQVGPIASDTNEFADVAYSVPTGPTSQLIHAYAQNGGAEDFQLFSESPANRIVITSLTQTQGFRGTVHHDFTLPTPTPYAGGNATTGDWFWSDDTWGAELLRIETDEGVQVMAGDYDSASFGAFIPHVPDELTVPPRADAGPDIEVCPDAPVTLDASGSFDGDFVPGDETPSWEWDLDVSVDSDGNTVPDDDIDATGPTVTTTFPPGTTRVKVTYTDDDGESSFDFVDVTASDTVAPGPSCPAVVRGTAVSWDGGPASPVATATDDCDPDPAIVNDRTDGGADASDTYPCGATLVTFTATDASGNSASCTSLVIVTPDAPADPVGPALRVTKTGADEPVLDWSLAGPSGADAKWAVLKGARRADVPFHEWREPLDAATITDAAAAGGLVLYDVRRVRCDGTLSRD